MDESVAHLSQHICEKAFILNLKSQNYLDSELNSRREGVKKDRILTFLCFLFHRKRSDQICGNREWLNYKLTKSECYRNRMI